MLDIFVWWVIVINLMELEEVELRELSVGVFVVVIIWDDVVVL